MSIILATQHVTARVFPPCLRVNSDLVFVFKFAQTSEEPETRSIDVVAGQWLCGVGTNLKQDSEGRPQPTRTSSHSSLLNTSSRWDSRGEHGLAGPLSAGAWGVCQWEGPPAVVFFNSHSPSHAVCAPSSPKLAFPPFCPLRRFIVLRSCVVAHLGGGRG